MTIIKICGLKTIEDSLATCEAGADMLGFNFYESSVRNITPRICRPIVERVKGKYPHILCTGIFVNHKIEEIENIMRQCHLDLAQLSGNEPMNLLRKIGSTAFKAIRPTSLEEAQRLIEQLPKRETAPAFLLDTYQSGAYGGTGKVGNWELAAQIARKFPLFLAGGLGLKNISHTVEQIQPWGVDVASGVERVRGEKDLELVRVFIQTVRASDKIRANKSIWTYADQ
jgi:phosphoribosylanthranilate isomerase